MIAETQTLAIKHSKSNRIALRIVPIIQIPSSLYVTTHTIYKTNNMNTLANYYKK